MKASLHHHFILHKPYGYISQFISNAPKSYKKKFLGELYNFPEGSMSIGRLDEKSEGLLLITTDGRLSDTINSSGVEKEYYAQLDGIISPEAIGKMIQGVEIGINGSKYITQPCKVQKIVTPNFPLRKQKIRDDRHGPTSWVSITVSEGKFRQVRKMTSAVGFATLRLIRVRVGIVKLDSLPIGSVKKLNTII